MADPNCPMCHGCGSYIKQFIVTDSNGEQHEQQLAVPCTAC